MYKLSDGVKDARTKNDLYNMVRRRQEEKARGEVHTPLYTLRELAESAGISKSQFLAMCKYHADIAPVPRLITRHDSHYVPAHFKAFLAEVKTRNATLQLCMQFLKRHGFTQLEVSKRIGADHSMLSKALTGSTPSCPKDVMDKIQALVKTIEDQPNPEQKGTVIMSSSIADAFQKALSKTQAHIVQPSQPAPTIPADWDDEGGAATIEAVTTKEPTMSTPTTNTTKSYLFKPSNNVTRATFNYIRDNAGCTRVGAVDALSKLGYKKSSTTSLVGQMLKQGIVRESHGGLFANQEEYIPIKQRLIKGKKLAEIVAANPKRKYVKRNAPVKAKTPAPKVEQKTKRVASTNTLLADEFDAQKFVDGMTLKQAKAVYDCLRVVFGVML